MKFMYETDYVCVNAGGYYINKKLYFRLTWIHMARPHPVRMYVCTEE